MDSCFDSQRIFGNTSNSNPSIVKDCTAYSAFDAMARLKDLAHARWIVRAAAIA